jgi:hypothetical protein
MSDVLVHLDGGPLGDAFNMVFIVVWMSNAFAAAWSSEMETGMN